MPHWKAGPEKPKYPFCWLCSNKLYGRQFARVVIDDIERHVHKACADEMPAAERPAEGEGEL